MNKTDSAKTYSKKNPVLVQKVLTFNKEEGRSPQKSPLKSPQKVKEEEQVVKEEVEERWERQRRKRKGEEDTL